MSIVTLVIPVPWVWNNLPLKCLSRNNSTRGSLAFIMVDWFAPLIKAIFTSDHQGRWLPCSSYNLTFCWKFCLWEPSVFGRRILSSSSLIFIFSYNHNLMEYYNTEKRNSGPLLRFLSVQEQVAVALKINLCSVTRIKRESKV